jgi:hypothetical protein
MAIPIAVNDVLQVTAEGVNERFPWAWVSHWRATGVTDAVSHGTALLLYVKALITDFAIRLTDEWQCECLKLSRVAPSPMGIRFYSDDDFPIVGSVVTDGVPNQSCAVGRMQSDEVGASNRGRIYLCGIPEVETDGGQLTNAEKVALDAHFLSNFIPGYSQAGDVGLPVIFSRTLYGTDPPGHPINADDYTATITAVDFQYNLGVIRNRRYPRNSQA